MYGVFIVIFTFDLGHSECQYQGYVHFDGEYLVNNDIEQKLLLWTNMNTIMLFRLLYFTFDIGPF